MAEIENQKPEEKIEEAGIEVEQRMPTLPEELKEFTDIPIDGQRIIYNLFINNLFDAITKLALGFIKFADTQVFSGNATIGFSDLDLSGTVGSKTSLVYLRVKNTSAGANAYRFRINGDTDNVTGGVTELTSLEAGDIGYTIVKTDSSGVIEWNADIVEATDIDILVYT